MPGDVYAQCERIFFFKYCFKKITVIPAAVNGNAVAGSGFRIQGVKYGKRLLHGLPALIRFNTYVLFFRNSYVVPPFRFHVSQQCFFGNGEIENDGIRRLNVHDRFADS